MMQIIHPQLADLVPLFRGTHRLVGLAIVAQVDHSRITLLLQLAQVGLCRLIADRDRCRDRTLDVHGSLPRLGARQPTSLSANEND